MGQLNRQFQMSEETKIFYTPIIYLCFPYIQWFLIKLFNISYYIELTGVGFHILGKWLFLTD